MQFRLLSLLSLFAFSAASSSTTLSLECWQNSDCDVSDPEYGQYCNEHSYDSGSCYPLAGSNMSSQYSCNATHVAVTVHTAYGCVDTKPRTTVYPVDTCMVAGPRAFNTVYQCKL